MTIERADIKLAIDMAIASELCGGEAETEHIVKTLENCGNEIDTLKAEVKSEQQWASFYAQESMSRQATIAELLAELLRVREICLRECGIGIVNEVVIASVKEMK